MTQLQERISAFKKAKGSRNRQEWRHNSKIESWHLRRQGYGHNVNGIMGVCRPTEESKSVIRALWDWMAQWENRSGFKPCTTPSVLWKCLEDLSQSVPHTQSMMLLSRHSFNTSLTQIRSCNKKTKSVVVPYFRLLSGLALQAVQAVNTIVQPIVGQSKPVVVSLPAKYTNNFTRDQALPPVQYHYVPTCTCLYITGVVALSSFFCSVSSKTEAWISRLAGLDLCCKFSKLLTP